MSQVRFDHVWKRFGTLPVVRDLNLEVTDGEFLVLVGPSGCGKSTTLRMLAGLETVSEGKVFIAGRDVTDAEPRERDIAMVFQSYALYPHMSVRDNIAFGLRNRGVAAAEVAKKVDAAGRMLEITHLLDRRPRALSGGQRQRVALGRAIVRDAAVFLMDEPLSNLDAQLRVNMRGEIIKLHQRLGSTTVYVTHDQVEAMTMGSRVAVLKDGILVQVATAQELYERPRNIFVATFIGSPSMNILQGIVERRNGAGIAYGEGLLPLLPSTSTILEGQTIEFGIRPEHLQLNEASSEGKSGIVATVSLVEIMGDESIVTLAHESDTIRAKVRGFCSFRYGDKVSLTVESDKLHLFNAETTERISDDRGVIGNERDRFESQAGESGRRHTV
jgi:multiple sugar transport system ATP-binding protein